MSTVGSTARSSPPDCIVALFDDAGAADRAIGDLLAAGIPASGVDRHEADAAPTATQAEDTPGMARSGFWNRLLGADRGVDADRNDRTINAGAVIVAVRPPSDRLEDVIGILEAHQPVDMDERDGDTLPQATRAESAI